MNIYKCDVIDNSRQKISEVQYQEIIKNKKELFCYSTLMDFYYIVKQNINDLYKEIDKRKKRTIFSEKETTDFAEINRHLMNIVNSFYAFVEYCEKNIKSFKKIKTKYYDNNFEYRLLYNLRIFITHNGGVAITTIESVLNQNDGNEIDLYSDIEFLKEGNYNGKFKAELNEIKDSKINIKDIIVAFEEMMCQLLCEIFVVEKETIMEKMKYFIKQIPNYYLKKNQPTISVFVQVDEKIEMDLFGVITKFYGKFGNITIYKNDILNDSFEIKKGYEDIFKMFQELSFIYYGELGVVCKKSL